MALRVNAVAIGDDDVLREMQYHRAASREDAELRAARALVVREVLRLRRITAADLEAELGVVAQWRQQGDRFVPVPPGPNLRPARGVRRVGDDLQLGLTSAEIDKVRRNLDRLIAMVDDGSIKTY